MTPTLFGCSRLDAAKAAFAFGAALFHLQGTAWAQEAAQSPAFRVSVNRVQITAVVTDSKGRHVPGLKMADFRLLDGGDPQELTSCEYIRLAEAGAASPAAHTHLRQGLTAPPFSVAHELSRAEVQRVIVFLADDESFAAATMPAVRGALRNAIERNIGLGDLAAVIRTSSGNSSLEQFTSDRRILLESAGKIGWQPGSRGNPGMLAQTSGRVIGEENGMSGYLVKNSENRTIAALRYSISALRDFPGRKAIFFISQSLPIGMDYFYSDPSQMATEVGKLVDEALRAGVVVYSVDPTPLSSLTPDASYNLSEESRAAQAARGKLQTTPTTREVVGMTVGYTSRAVLFLETFRSGLRALAEGTGGRMAADTDAATALSRFAGDLQGYYVLTYRPRDPERYFDPKGGDPPPFRSIKVRVARTGMRVRSYAGYIAASDKAGPDRPAHGQFSEALFSPFAATGVRVDLTSLFTVPQPASPEISLLLHIEARGLTFVPGEDGRHNAEFLVAARVSGERSDSTQAVARRAELRLGEKEYGEAMRLGITYRLSVPVRRAGLYDVRAAVQDSSSGRLGSAREFVEVPELKNGRPAASGILAYSVAAREADSEAPGAPALRRFRRDDNLSFACQLFNMKSATGEALVLRDGKQVLAATAEVVANGDGTSTARGVIPLAALAPGSYVLRFVAREDPGTDVKAAQWTDFEIVQ